MESRVLFTEDEIRARVKTLGREVVKWARSGAESAEGNVCMLWLAEGAFVFAADLARAIDCDIRVRSVRASSYGNAFKSSGTVSVNADFSEYKNMRVLIVDDIFDTGRTLAEISRRLLKEGATEIKTCVMLKKNTREKRNFPPPDFFGFEIPDEYVFGYGLDAAEKFRNLPDIRFYKD